jgi:integrase/recombinase XerD
MHMGSLYERDGKWGIDYRDAKGRRVRKMVAADRRIAQHALGEAMAAVEKVKAGVLQADPREAKRPLSEHIESYVEDLKRRGRDGMYRYIIQKRLEGAAFAQDWACLKDITPRTVSAYLKDLSAEGKSAKTVNAHRADLSAFFEWLMRQGALEANPCQQVQKSAVSRDKLRRALSVAECRRLIQTAPEERRVCYLTLLYTGLRRAEAAALRWGYVHLDVANPHVELPGSLTKSGQPETVALVPELADALAEYRGKAKAKDAVFAGIPSMDQFREDLAAAEIPEVDERGRRVVLHSLRHSLATMLAAAKVPPAVAMQVMRHRDIRLTLQAYTDEGLLPAAAAVAALPSLIRNVGA